MSTQIRHDKSFRVFWNLLDRQCTIRQLRLAADKYGDRLNDPALRKRALAMVQEELCDIACVFLLDQADAQAAAAALSERAKADRDKAIKRRVDAWKAGNLLSFKTLANFEGWASDAGVGSLAAYHAFDGARQRPIPGDYRDADKGAAIGFRPAAGFVAITVPVEGAPDFVAAYAVPEATCSWTAGGRRSFLFRNGGADTGCVQGGLCSVSSSSPGLALQTVAPVSNYAWDVPPCKADIDADGYPEAIPPRLAAAIAATVGNPSALDRLLLS